MRQEKKPEVFNRFSFLPFHYLPDVMSAFSNKTIERLNVYIFHISYSCNTKLEFSGQILFRQSYKFFVLFSCCSQNYSTSVSEYTRFQKE